MKILRILFWVNTAIFVTGWFIAAVTGNYDTAIWISLCILFYTIDWVQTKRIDEQKKYLEEWRKLTLEYRELADRAIAETQKAYGAAFRMAMLLGIDNEITE